MKRHYLTVPLTTNGVPNGNLLLGRNRPMVHQANGKVIHLHQLVETQEEASERVIATTAAKIALNAKRREKAKITALAAWLRAMDGHPDKEDHDYWLARKPAEEQEAIRLRHDAWLAQKASYARKAAEARQARQAKQSQLN